MTTHIIALTAEDVVRSPDGRAAFLAAGRAGRASGLLMVTLAHCPACRAARPLLEEAALRDPRSVYAVLDVEAAAPRLAAAGMSVPHVPFFVSLDGEGRALGRALASTAVPDSVEAVVAAARSGAGPRLASSVQPRALHISRKRVRSAMEEAPQPAAASTAGGLRLNDQGHVFIEFGEGPIGDASTGPTPMALF